MMNQPVSVQERFRGILIGTAVGDALGLPAEGISRRRLKKIYHGHWRHRLFLGRGMISDDTEHTIFVAQSLLAHPDSAEKFARRLSWCLRWWFLALPAGIGLATLRAIVRLWLGFPPARSGVFSAGNGPAMRVAPIGALFASDESVEQLRQYVSAATRMTHTDPKAETGALAIARLIAWTVREQSQQRPELNEFITLLRDCAEQDPEWSKIVDTINDATARQLTVSELATQLGLEKGISGYIYHTVPIAVYAWYHHFGDYRKTLIAVLDCGGDTDTVGAISGALAGAAVGAEGIPQDWINGIADWPRGISLLYTIADRLAQCHENTDKNDSSRTPVHYFWPAVLPRNLWFLIIVLTHGFRRLAPPY